MINNEGKNEMIEAQAHVALQSRVASMSAKEIRHHRVRMRLLIALGCGIVFAGLVGLQFSVGSWGLAILSTLGILAGGRLIQVGCAVLSALCKYSANQSVA